MDPQLEEDFAEALEGCNPIQFLLEDPHLATVAQDLLDILGNDDTGIENIDSTRFEDVTIDVGSTSGDSCTSTSPSLSPHSVNETNSKDITANDNAYPKKKSNGRTITYNYKCVACARPARGYHYFGAIVCNGCRSFFCRSIKNDLYKSYACSETLKCQHCRFEMLLNSGMKIPDNNQNRIQKFSKDLHADNFVYLGKKGSLTRMYLDKTRELLTNAGSLSLTEKTAVEEVTSWQFSVSVEIFRRLIRTNLKLFRETLETYYTGHRHSLKTQKLVENYLTYGIQKSYAERDCWAIKDNLSSKDRARLVTSNYPLVMEFMEAFKLRTEESGELSQEAEAFVGSMVEGLDGDEEKQVLFDIHKEVSQGGKLKASSSTYDRVYDLEGLGLTQSAEKLNRHRNCAQRVGLLTRHKWDPVALMLNTYIIMYSGETLELYNPKEAERLQHTYAFLLYRYLKDKGSSESMRVFGDSMQVISYVRELRQFKENAYKKHKIV